MNNNHIWGDMKMRDDDVFISSTVKSGTTWLQQIVSQIIFEGEFKENLSDISIWIDNLREYNREMVNEIISKQNHRRFFKTHSPANIVLKNKNKNAKYIFITRDFRDVIWSFHNHFINSKYQIKNYDVENSIEYKLKNSKTPYEFWKIVMNNKNLFHEIKEYKIIWSYFNTIKSWLEEINNKNVLILHFNQLKKDLKGNIVKISEFLGYNYDEELINKIYEKCTFEWMKRNCKRCVPPQFTNQPKNFINKGTNKRWKNIFNDNDIIEYKKLINEFFDKETINWIENGNFNIKKKVLKSNLHVNV